MTRRGRARQRHPDGSPGPLEINEPAVRLLLRGRTAASRFAMLGPHRSHRGHDDVEREWPLVAHEVSEVLHAAQRPLGHAPGQLGLDPSHNLGVEQVRECPGVVSEELGEQVGVQGEGRGAPFGERGVAVVEELGGVGLQEGPRERRGRGRAHLDDVDAASGDVGHELAQGIEVEVVPQALARGFEQDGEIGEFARRVEELGRAQSLLPQRLPPVGATAGEQEGAGGGLAEPRREERRTDDVLAHGRRDLGRVEQESLEVDQAATGRSAWCRSPRVVVSRRLRTGT